jgi:hypothetical protein
MAVQIAVAPPLGGHDDKPPRVHVQVRARQRDRQGLAL